MKTDRPITSFTCLTFDCFATLVDWESGIYEAIKPLHAAADRQALLKSFIRIEDRVLDEHPKALYKDGLAMIYGEMAKELGITATEDEKNAFGASVGDWPAFPDTLDALRRLQKHYKLVILSNVDLESFGRTLSDQMPGITFDAIYTAQEIGSYKPDLNNFEFMTSALAKDHGVKKEDIIHTAQALWHDHAPAKKHGLVSAWIERGEHGEAAIGGNLKEMGDTVDITWQFKTMGAMADFVDTEAAKN